MKGNKSYGNDRNNNMGTIHLLAAVLVILGHQRAVLGLPNFLVLGNPIHSIGVKAIFLISGYLITKSAWRLTGSGIKRFAVYAAKRLGRIYPEFIVCLFFSTFILGPVFTILPVREYFDNIQGLLFYFISNINLYITYSLPGVFLNNPYPSAVNGSLWTMPVEVALYLLVFIISLFSARRKALYATVTVAVTAASFVRFVFFPHASKVFYGTDLFQALNLAPFFLAGGMAYLYDIRKYLNVQLAAMLLLMGGSISFSSLAVSECVSFFLLSYFILSLMLDSVQGLKTKWLRSEYAYGMYLWSFPLQQCIVQIFYTDAPHPLGFWPIFVISVVCAYLTAALSYEAIYLPVNRQVNKRIVRIGKGGKKAAMEEAAETERTDMSA